VFWPFDLLIFAGDAAALRRIATWRVAVAAWSIFAYFVLGRVRAVQTHYVLSLAAFSVGTAVITGAITTDVGAPARPFFFGHHIIPICSVALVASLRARVAVIAVTCVSSIAACAYADPSLVGSATLGVYLCMLFGSAGLAVVGGHQAMHLIRDNFLQARALERRAEELRQLDRMKSEFFADISHELRTPLTLILGGFRALQSDVQADAARGAIESGLRSSSRLLQLVNEILELARIEQGSRPVDQAPLDLAALTRRAVADFDSSEGAAWFSVTGADVPVPVSASRQQMTKLLYNLLSNAVKFTDPATRRIRVSLDASKGKVVLTVADNGIGIPTDQLDRIFERFVRLESGSAPSREGTGIGLALVKGIVSQAGGRVDVESTLGRGSTFTVTLPRGDVSGFRAGERDDLDEDLADVVQRYAASRVTSDTTPGVPSRPERPRDGRPTVVLVEDNAELRRYTRRILSERFHVIDARDGAEALELCRADPPSLILTDVMMPRMTGPELLRAVRCDDALRETPVVFLTARAGADARSESLEGGADDYVCKPFEERELVARVENLVEKRRQALELAELNGALEARIAARTAELHALAAHLSEVLEQERARIARDIHDELGQTLSAMRLEVEHAAREHATTAGGRAALERITHLLAETIGTSRRILAELRPRVLDDFGLVAGLEWLVEQFRARYDVRCQLAIGPDVDADAARSTALFRIVQECLTNVAKHAAARRVDVSIALEATTLRLLVSDDGKGMEVPAGGARGMGLLGIRERALQFGGVVDVRSSPGQGTSIHVEIPTAGARRGEGVAA
jgi:signal transduction histidine kinase